MPEPAKSSGHLLDSWKEIATMVFLAVYAIQAVALTFRADVTKGHLLLVLIGVGGLCTFQGVKYMAPQLGALWAKAKAVPEVPRG